MFKRGGTLNAVGAANNNIQFKLVPGATYFYGLQFENPGADPNPNLSPVATSTLQYVRVDSASGVGVSGGISSSAAINGGDRHKLLIDSVTVRKAWNTAISAAASGSQLTRVLIDTTGQYATGYTTSYPALAVGRKSLVQGVLVRRSGSTGILVQAPYPYTDTTATLEDVHILAALGPGIDAQNAGIIKGDLGAVTIDGSAYPYRGTIDNFAALARDAASQNKWLGSPATDQCSRSRPATGTLARGWRPRSHWATRSPNFATTSQGLRPAPSLPSITWWSKSHDGILKSSRKPIGR